MGGQIRGPAGEGRRGPLVLAVLALLPLLAIAAVPQQAKAVAFAPGWYLQDPAPDRATNLFDVDFVDQVHGFAVGQSGVFTMTEDGGRSWTTKTIDPERAQLTGVSFVDSQNGHAVGDNKILATSDGGDTWTRQFACEDPVPNAAPPCTATSSTVAENFKKVMFTDARTGHAIGGTGTSTGAAGIFSTVDGGSTWRYTRAPNNVSDVSFTDGPNCPSGTPGCYGHVVGSQGLIMATTDGGATWTQQFVCTTSSPCTAASPDRDFSRDAVRSFASVSFLDELRGHAVASGIVIATTDGGQTWREQPTPDGRFSNFGGISFGDANHGRAVGAAKAIGTSDGGRTWQFETIFVNDKGARAVSCTTRVSCHAAGVDGVWVYRTAEDDGLSTLPPPPVLPAPEPWGRQASPINGTDETLRAVDFTDGPGCPVEFPRGCYGYAVGDGGVIFATVDGGRTWKRQVSGTTAALVSVSFTDSLHGHIGGGNGVLLATSDGGVNWTPQNPRALCNQFGCYGVRGISFADGPSCPPEYPRGCYGVAVAAAGLIIATTDGGATWRTQSAPVGSIFHGVSCSDHLHCTIVGQAEGFNATAIILATTDGGMNWLPQNAGQGDPPLKAVSFSDNQHGHAVGGNVAKRSILATESGGTVWVSQVDPSPDPLVSELKAVSFTDARNGHAVGAGSIHVTTDGGTNWTQQFACETSDACTASSAGRIRSTLYGVSFTDELRGHAVGDGGTIIGTTDGGKTWRVELRGTVDLLGVAFPDASHGYVVGERGTILFSPNEGKGWTPQPSGTTETLRGVSFPAATHGYAVGDRGTIVVTTDGGRTWRAQTSGVSDVLQAVSFADTQNGHVVGDNGTILVTTDGGARWTRQQLPGGVSGKNLLGVSFVSTSTGHAVGAGGTIVATNDGGATWLARSSGVTFDLVGVSFGSAETGHAVGLQQADLAVQILATRDGGQTWDVQHVCKDVLPDSPPCTASSPYLRKLSGAQLRAVSFTGPMVGHAVGMAVSEGVVGEGLVLATADGGRTWVKQSLTASSIDSLYAVATPKGDSSDTWAVGAAGTIASTFSPPGRITDLTAIALDQSTVRLAWGAVGQEGDGQGVPAQRYQIRQSAAPLDDANFEAAGAEQLCDGACFAGTISKLGDPAAFDVSGLQRGVTYHWGVRAVDRHGLIGPVSTVSAQIPDLVPGTVTDLVATALSSTAVELAFSAPGSDDGAPPPASAYVIKQSSVPIAGLADFDQGRTLCGGVDCTGFSPVAVGDKLSLKVTGLRPDTTYFYALRARDAAGQLGPMSNVAQVITGPLCAPLGSLSATQAGYPAGYSLVGLPGGTRMGANSELFGWFNQREGDYSVDGPDEPVTAGRGYWAWFRCPSVVELATTAAADANFALGAYRASMVGNPSGSGPSSVTGHDYTARWDPTLNAGAGGYRLSGYREPSVLAVGEGIWAFSYVDTTLSIARP